jgi:cytochrome c
MKMAWNIALLVGACLILAGCDNAAKEQARNLTGGDPDLGKSAIGQYGCSTCHTIPGIAGADALVGPPLNRMGGRVYIGGVIQNTPQNMMRWLENPPAIDPLTAMPNLHMNQDDARNIASYLYTLR